MDTGAGKGEEMKEKIYFRQTTYEPLKQECSIRKYGIMIGSSMCQFCDYFIGIGKDKKGWFVECKMEAEK